MFENLNPLLLSQPRLSIMSFLKKNREADFKIIKEQTGISAGNLSIQLNNLKNADYIEIIKQFKGNYPLTICRITSLGSNVIDDFFKAIKSYEQNADEIQTLPL